MALFVEVAKTRSFTRAAAQLQMPVSSLSRRIAQLEATIGLRLLHRTTRKVEPTEAGSAYFSRCVGLVDEARAAHHNLQEMFSVPRGVLRLSLTADFGASFLAAHLITFRALYPEVTIEMDLSPRRVDLLSENFDVALRIGRLADSSLIARRLATLHLAPYAAPDYLARRGRPRRPEDLARHDCLRMLAGDDRAHWTLRRPGHDPRRVVLASPYIANSLGMIRRLVLLGAGIGSLDDMMVVEDLAAGRLVRVLPAWRLSSSPLYAVTAARLMPGKTRVFIDHLAAAFAPWNGEGPD